MPDNIDDDLGARIGDGFALPVTDTFLTGVHRGVRRRRALRVAAASGVVAVAAGVMTVVVTVTGPAHQASPPGPTAGSITADPVHRPLDGYRVTFLPDGLRVGVAGDGSAVYPVSKDQLHNDDRPPPTPETATAATSLRTYVRPGGGNWMSISVLRPQRTTAEVSRAQITAWLTGWATKGADVTDDYQVPAGRARLTTFVGSEVTVHTIVITTPDGVVIVVDGNAAAPVADLRAVAAGIRPQ